MELSKINNEEFNNPRIVECLSKWNLLAFREGNVDPSPIVLVYSGPASDVLKHWTQVVHDIALNFQAELPKQRRRNLCLAFITSALPREAVREIRDDTYCCKKIVLEATGANALHELDRYYLGNHKKTSATNDLNSQNRALSQPLSLYIYEKHPEVKSIMSTKP